MACTYIFSEGLSNVSKMPEGWTMRTRKLYYENPYVQKFEAKIVKISKKNDKITIILDKTAFYPEGGGQPHDTGVIEGRNGIAHVYRVLEENGEILHFVSIEGKFEEGEEVIGRVDWERRIEHMRHHTAAHIVWGAIKRVLGHEVKAAGSDLTTKKARLDVFIGKGKRITAEQIREIERLSNQVILENRPVRTYFISAKDALERFPDVELKKEVEMVRVVEIEDWDVNFCGGTHVSRTGEVLAIKIFKRERISEGTDRLLIAAGKSALSMLFDAHNTLQEISEIAKTKDVKNWVISIKNKLKDAEAEIEKLSSKIYAYKLLRHLERIERFGVLVMEVDCPKKLLSEVARAIVAEEPNAIVILGRKDGGAALVGAAGRNIPKFVNVSEVLGEVAKAIGGKTKGSAEFAQGGGPKGEKLNQALEDAKKILKAKLLEFTRQQP